MPTLIVCFVVAFALTTAPWLVAAHLGRRHTPFGARRHARHARRRQHRLPAARRARVQLHQRAAR